VVSSTSEVVRREGLSTQSLDRLLNPSSIAVIGASSKRQAWGNNVLNNLEGFDGDIVAVHPSASELEGYPTVRSVSDLNGRCDVAFVAVPKHALIDTVIELDAAGIPAAIVVTGGLDPHLSAQFKAVLRQVEIVVMGPNCMGFIDFHRNTRLFPGSIGDVSRGDVGLVAQSGSAAIALMNNTDFGISTVVTSGNEWSMTTADYLSWFAVEPNTRVIGLVLESVQDPQGLLSSIRQCWSAGKDVVLLKVGRSEQGAESTIAHTGAMLTDSAAADAFFARNGIVSVFDYDELTAALTILRSGRRFLARGDLAIAGISGGQTGLAADLADRHEVRLAPLELDTEAAIQSLLDGHNVVNPLDVGAVPGLNGDKYRTAVTLLAEDSTVAALFLVQDAQETLAMGPEHTYNRVIAPGMISIAETSRIPIVVVSSTSARIHPLFVEQLAGADLPTLASPRPSVLGRRSRAQFSVTRRSQSMSRLSAFRRRG